jgi:hypothetical protein
MYPVLAHHMRRYTPQVGLWKAKSVFASKKRHWTLSSILALIYEKYTTDPTI